MDPICTTGWPDQPGPFVALIDASSHVELSIITDWITRSTAGGTEPIGRYKLPASRRRRPFASVDPAIGERLAREDDPLCVPVRVAWLAPERDGVRKVGFVDVLKPGDPRDPNVATQHWLLLRHPDRCRIVVGEPARRSASSLLCCCTERRISTRVNPNVTRRMASRATLHKTSCTRRDLVTCPSADSIAQPAHGLDQLIVIIAELAAQRSQPPIFLPQVIADPEAMEFTPVRLSGLFLHDRELFVGARVYKDEVGFHVVTPFVLADGRTVLVDRGWVPADHKDPAMRPQGQLAGEVTVVGLVHAPWRRGWFVPANDPARNLWFYGDLAAMAAHIGAARVAPVFVDADATPNPGGLPVGGQTKIVIRNDHLQYAITWFALALALAVMFVLYHRRPSA